MSRLLLDGRLAIRVIRRNPAFTIFAAGTLALGIGANTAIFTIVNGVLLKPPPFHEPERIVHVWETSLPEIDRVPTALPAVVIE